VCDREDPRFAFKVEVVSRDLRDLLLGTGRDGQTILSSCCRHAYRTGIVRPSTVRSSIFRRHRSARSFCRRIFSMSLSQAGSKESLLLFWPSASRMSESKIKVRRRKTKHSDSLLTHLPSAGRRSARRDCCTGIDRKTTHCPPSSLLPPHPLVVQ
jgi:hypothetical protein